MRKIFLAILTLMAFSIALPARAASDTVMVVSLQQCRQLAIDNNKTLAMAGAAEREAYYQRKAAFTSYLPRVDGTAAYMRTGRELSLLSADQRTALSNVGSAMAGVLPQLAPLAPQLNGIGESLVDALRTDTRNAAALGVMLTQPLYMGGKIRAYNQITEYALEIARNNSDLALQDLIVEVDEAYWRIVELEAKQELAQSYYQLVDTLHSNVQKMIDAGIATRADGLSVAVKVNEAQVALIQVENGLALSRMLLCQICGLPIDTDIMPADTSAGQTVAPAAEVATALAERPELRSLALAEKIASEKVKLTRAEYLPHVALTGGYMATSPSVFNSFEKKLKGMWAVGVVAQIPLITSGERYYKTKAAQAAVESARLRRHEVEEKVELQVHQAAQRLDEARQRQQKADASRQQADENLRYARLGMAEGVIPVSNVLEAQTAWLAAHAETITAGIDMQLANVYLNKALGTVK